MAQTKRKKTRIAVETTVRVEKDEFKRPTLILPPEVPEGTYQLLAVNSGKFVVVMLKKELKKKRR